MEWVFPSYSYRVSEEEITVSNNIGSYFVLLNCTYSSKMLIIKMGLGFSKDTKSGPKSLAQPDISLASRN